MNRRLWAIIAAAILGAISLIWVLGSNDDVGPERVGLVTPESSPRSHERSSVSLPANWPPAMPAGVDEPRYVPLTPLEPDEPATQSLADAREHGDSRAPPVQHTPESLDHPTPAELADPAAYQQYETRQNTRLYSAYVQAADANVPKLREDIARARMAGIAPEQIAKVEEKVRRIEEMRRMLLSEHAELRR